MLLVLKERFIVYCTKYSRLQWDWNCEIQRQNIFHSRNYLTLKLHIHILGLYRPTHTHGCCTQAHSNLSHYRHVVLVACHSLLHSHYMHVSEFLEPITYLFCFFALLSRFRRTQINFKVPYIPLTCKNWISESIYSLMETDQQSHRLLLQMPYLWFCAQDVLLVNKPFCEK